MASKKIKLIVVGVVLIVTFCVLIILRFAMASGSASVDWFTGDPTVNQEVIYSGNPPATKDCMNVTLQVQRSLTSAPFEEQCYVPTSMGLMTQLYYTQGVVQAQGYAKAYPVNFVQGGNPIIDPVRNQASGIWFMGYSQGPGIVLGYFRQLSNLLKLNVSAGGIYYSIPAPSTPDFIFRHPDNSVAAMNVMTKSISQNGRYMVIDGLGAGFVRINLMNVTVKSFASTLYKINGYSLTNAQTAIDDTGRYAAIAYNADGGWGTKYFKLVDVNSCTTPEADYNKIQDQTNFESCRTLDLSNIIKQKVPTVQAITNIKFNNEQTISFDVSYTVAGVTKYARYSLTAFGQMKRAKAYLALGDSYISGEGAYSYREGTDTLRNKCHQSLWSYPYLLGSRFESFASVACSGARMVHMRTKGDDRADQLVGNNRATQEEKDIAEEERMPGALEQTFFVAKDNPEAITISIGGNDIGFGQIMEKCINPIKNQDENIETAFLCYDTYEDRAELVNTINSKFTELRALYKELKNDGGAGRRVYVIGYPQVTKVGGDCGLNVQMNATEVQFAHDLVEHLNATIKKAADEAGVMYVDTQHAFDGHLLCEAAPGEAAMNGATPSRSSTGGFDFKASFHPNQRGHQMLADTIAAQTNNLTKAMPTALTETAQPQLDPNLAVLQNVPKTGRAIRYVQVVSGLVDDIMHPLDHINFTLDPQDFLLKAGGVYNLVINSTPVNLGNFTTNTQGELSVSAILPASVPPGFHTIHVYGSDVYGNLIDIQQVVFVTGANADDLDSDGLQNGIDSCPLATQSGFDMDQDNIDDACDPLIDKTPTTPPTEEGIIWWDKPYIPITIKASSGR